MSDPGEWKPRLASKARMKFDPVARQQLLLFPEAALVLNDTAAAIVRLCDGQRSVAAIVDELAGAFPDGDAGLIGADVRTFLDTIRQRGLLE
jgi:coenzyme PQQ biosynthesis protein PqqD